jgi:hypothetical protein
MPPRYVKTIREEIFYEYAKLMSRSAFQGEINYGFVTDRFKGLRDGAIAMSGTIRELQREQELPRACVFCGVTGDLQMEEIEVLCRRCTLARACKEWGTEQKLT